MNSKWGQERLRKFYHNLAIKDGYDFVWKLASKLLTAIQQKWTHEV